MFHGIVISLSRGKNIPLTCFNKILRDTLSHKIMETHLKLCNCKPLFRSFANPLHCLYIIRIQNFAVLVEKAKGELSLWKILFSGFASPLHRFHLILRHTSARGITAAQSELSISIPFFRICLQFLNCLICLRRELCGGQQQNGEQSPKCRFHIAILAGFKSLSSFARAIATIVDDHHKNYRLHLVEVALVACY